MCKLSICITIKNRSLITLDGYKKRYIFPHCIESLQRVLTEEDDAELVVADWGSTDINMRDYLSTISFPGSVHLLNLKSKKGFSKGVGQNQAAAFANSPALFFLDADILVENRYLIEDGISYCKRGEVLYPKGWRRGDYEGKTGYTFTGVGNFFIRKDTFWMAGGMPEYWSWGFEDFEFQKKLEKLNIKFSQIGYTGFIHQYHPEDLLWKNKETVVTDNEVERLKQFREKYGNEYKIDEENDQRLMSMFTKSIISGHRRSFNNPFVGIKPIGTL
jgi:glycosyltransferase involved in cell wall biosynthesis